MVSRAWTQYTRLIYWYKGDAFSLHYSAVSDDQWVLQKTINLMTFYFFFSAYVKLWVSKGVTREPGVFVCTRLDFHFVVECLYIWYISYCFILKPKNRDQQGTDCINVEPSFVEAWIWISQLNYSSNWVTIQFKSDIFLLRVPRGCVQKLELWLVYHNDDYYHHPCIPIRSLRNSVWNICPFQPCGRRDPINIKSTSQDKRHLVIT